jgi:hypothetical protein
VCAQGDRQQRCKNEEARQNICGQHSTES